MGKDNNVIIKTNDYELIGDREASHEIGNCVVIANDVKLRNIHFRNKVTIDSSKFVSIGNCIFGDGLEIIDSNKVVVKDSILKNVVIKDSCKILIGNNFVDKIQCEGSKVIVVNCVVKDRIIGDTITLVNNLIEGIFCENKTAVGNCSLNGKKIPNSVSESNFLPLPDSIEPLPVFLVQPWLNKNVLQKTTK